MARSDERNLSYSDLSFALVVSFVALWVGAFAAVIWSVAAAAHWSLTAVFPTLLFNGTALLLVLLALRGWLDFLRFRTSYLRLDAPFNPAGAELAGTIEMRIPESVPDLAFDLCLRCKRRDGQRTARTLWQEQLTLGHGDWQAAGSKLVLPFGFVLPPELPAHGARVDGASNVWSLHVTARGRSLKYRLSFDLSAARGSALKR